VTPCSVVVGYQRFRGPCCLSEYGGRPWRPHISQLRLYLYSAVPSCGGQHTQTFVSYFTSSQVNIIQSPKSLALIPQLLSCIFITLFANLPKGEFHNLCPSPNIVRVIKLRRMRWVGHVVRMGQMINEYKISVRKPEGKRLLGRSRRRW